MTLFAGRTLNSGVMGCRVATRAAPGSASADGERLFTGNEWSLPQLRLGADYT
jgi:hypothetical protein